MREMSETAREKHSHRVRETHVDRPTDRQPEARQTKRETHRHTNRDRVSE